MDFLTVSLFSLQTEVLNPDGTPAKDVKVEIEIEPDTVSGITKANGMAKLSINTRIIPEPLTVTVSK